MGNNGDLGCQLNGFSLETVEVDHYALPSRAEFAECQRAQGGRTSVGDVGGAEFEAVFVVGIDVGCSTAAARPVRGQSCLWSFSIQCRECYTSWPDSRRRRPAI